MSKLKFTSLFITFFGLLVLVGLWGGPATSAATADVTETPETAVYIVQLQDPPLASYRGDLPGLAATNPAARDGGNLVANGKLDANSPASLAYLSYLAQQQADFVTAVQQTLNRPVAVQFHYRYAFNGLALTLAPAEAETVAQMSGVRHVEREAIHTIQTDAGPDWIGAPTIWDGSATGSLGETLGEGIVIGIIDTGINTDHPSFADPGPVDGHQYTNPRGTYFGMCDPLTGLPFCNDKLIGAYDCTGGSGCLIGNPEDDNGHGSHTASTAAGNVVEAEIIAPTITLARTLSGVAPHAHIISYKACLAIGSCLTPVLQAAIDQATADAVDVINYSIGGSSTNPWTNANAQAFLGARDAGIFVATSAGNSGPGPETIGSPADAPWVMSVGASTHDRLLLNELVDMSGGNTTPPADIQGKSFTAGYGPAPIVHAADFGDGQCMNPFPAGTWTNGEIVICDRGTIPRLTKCDNVAAGGAEGCVLANIAADGESTVADPHTIPAIHIGYSAAQILEAWVRDGGSGHTATIAGTTAALDPAFGDIMAGFSSRGANPSVPNVLKPDVTAPGVDILAAVHTTNPLDPPEYASLSGTSMSSPHAAGAAALLRALQPDWTPAEVQSALMTTALNTTTRKEDGVSPTDPFDLGGGRIDLTVAARAGLTLNEGQPNYSNANPAQGGNPATLNIPSMADHDCLGLCGWNRVVASAVDHTVTWDVSVNAPQGMTLSVAPDSFTLAAGAEQPLQITADVSSLPTGQWAFAYVVLTPDDEEIPPAVLPVAVLPGGEPIPVTLDTRRAAGSTLVTGITSTLAISDLSFTSFGLLPGRITEEQVPQDPTPLEPYDSEIGTFYITVTVPSGARLLAAEIVETTSIDLDLFIGLDADGEGPKQHEELCRATTPEALESCHLVNPGPGVYWVMVQNWLSGQVIDDVVLETVVIPGSDENNLWASGPASVPAGEPFDVRVFWHENGMQPGEIWFGLVEMGTTADTSGNVGSLFVRLNRHEDDVAKVADQETAEPNDTVAYQVTIQPNVRDDTDLVYAITDTLPLGLTYVPDSAAASSGTVTVADNQITWSVNMPVDGNDVATLTYETTVDDPAPFCMLTNSAVHQTDDPGSRPLSERVDLAIDPDHCPEDAEADLAITKEASPDPAVVDSELLYTLTVVNNGPNAASGVMITDTLPAEVTFLSSSPGQPGCVHTGGVVHCFVAALNVGEEVEITIQVQVDAAATGSLTNTAAVSANETDPDPTNNQVTIQTPIVRLTYLPIIMR